MKIKVKINLTNKSIEIYNAQTNELVTDYYLINNLDAPMHSVLELFEDLKTKTYEIGDIIYE